MFVRKNNVLQKFVKIKPSNSVSFPSINDLEHFLAIMVAFTIDGRISFKVLVTFFIRETLTVYEE